jgi:hypothetical protein
MMYTIKKDFTKLLILAALGVGLIGASFAFTQMLPPRHAAPAAHTTSITLAIQDLYADKSIELASGETVLAMLQKLNAHDPAVALDTKTYAGMGTLVTQLGIHKNGDEGKYWQYKVNGVMPQIGADAYALKGGERVEWLFTTSQE